MGLQSFVTYRLVITCTSEEPGRHRLRDNILPRHYVGRRFGGNRSRSVAHMSSRCCIIELGFLDSQLATEWICH